MWFFSLQLMSGYPFLSLRFWRFFSPLIRSGFSSDSTTPSFPAVLVRVLLFCHRWHFCLSSLLLLSSIYSLVVSLAPCFPALTPVISFPNSTSLNPKSAHHGLVISIFPHTNSINHLCKHQRDGDQQPRTWWMNETRRELFGLSADSAKK